MKKRKHLCLITADTKETNARRTVTGILMQCQKYDYDLSVFSTATTLQYFNQQYTDGAANIYRLINFERFDGIIVDTLSLDAGGQEYLDNIIYKSIKEHAKCPVVNLSIRYKDYKTVISQNESILRNVCKHMIEVHDCRKFCLLTGHKGNVEAEQRLAIFLDEIEKHGINVDSIHITYGDFWYSSGEGLADRIASGEVEKPDAVICASNHMALGVINRLVKHGYKVPDDIAVIAFDTVILAMLNEISLASYESNSVGTSAEAVDYIRSIIEPDKELDQYICNPEDCFTAGVSCGCGVENKNLIKALGPSIYRTERNYADENLHEKIDIGYLMEGDCYERLCASRNIEECIENIAEYAYNVQPYENFYLCLREQWDDFNEDITSGYPEKMKIVVKSNEKTGEHFHANRQGLIFDTEEMLPGLMDERDEPSVFYFMSIHFNDTIFGYSVLQRKLDSKLMDVVYRNWIRFICSSLEMIRTRETYFNMSIKDPMTGLTNKRGMYEALDKMLLHIKPGEGVYVAVIDMDGLKYINDTFGHIEGDVCLKRLAHILNLITKENEISVRAGGDEFYVVGVGQYTEEMLEDKVKEFEQVIGENRGFVGKDYMLSASIGNTLWLQDSHFDIDAIIRIADEKMYRYKLERKMARR